MDSNFVINKISYITLYKNYFMNTYKIIIINFILLYFIFLTPQFISDYIYGLKFGTMKFIYKDKKNQLLSYHFNHRDYDGSLISNSIQNNIIKYKIEKNIYVYKFEQYQYLNNKRILKYSQFNSSISNLLSKIITNQNRTIKICIIISTRHKQINKIKKGNFIKLAYYIVNPNNNKLEICYKHDLAVKNIKLKKNLKNNTTFYDFIKTFYNVDYVFNSWKDLSSINSINNGLLIRQSTTKISKKDIYNLLYVKNKAFIILDFINEHYVISSITYF